MQGKVIAGQRVRRIRRERGLTHGRMAAQLGISTSYLNLIERSQRPVTVPFLLKLGQAFDIDLQRFAEDDEGRVTAQLREVFGDPLFARDLAYTIEGEIDRHRIPTRRMEDGRLALHPE